MLVLTRRNGESLFVTNDIEITVLGIKGNQVRIGVAAPQGCAIFREEVRTQYADRGGLAEALAEGSRLEAVVVPVAAEA